MEWGGGEECIKEERNMELDKRVRKEKAKKERMKRKIKQGERKQGEKAKK